MKCLLQDFTIPGLLFVQSAGSPRPCELTSALLPSRGFPRGEPLPGPWSRARVSALALDVCTCSEADGMIHGVMHPSVARSPRTAAVALLVLLPCLLIGGCVDRAPQRHVLRQSRPEGLPNRRLAHQQTRQVTQPRHDAGHARRQAAAVP